MLRVELAEMIMEYLGYNRSIVRIAIEEKVLEIIHTENLFSDYSYCIDSLSFERYLHNFNLRDKEIESIMCSF